MQDDHHLSSVDHFYRQVSSVEEVLPTLLAAERDLMAEAASQPNSQLPSGSARAVNEIMITLIYAAANHRGKNSRLAEGHDVDFGTPWTGKRMQLTRL